MGNGERGAVCEMLPSRATLRRDRHTAAAAG